MEWRYKLLARLLTGCVLIGVFAGMVDGQLAPPNRLSVEYLLCGGAAPGHVSLRPIGIDKPYPRLMWLVGVRNASERSVRQFAYQVQIFQLDRRSGARGAQPYWDSGKVIDNRNVFVSSRYKDTLKPLESDSDYQFMVKWYSTTGLESEYSEPANFSTALFEQSEFLAHWIASPTVVSPVRSQMVRGTFELPSGKQVARSRLFVTGLGYYELWQSGSKLDGQRRLGPQTYFQARVLYDTKVWELNTGANVIAMRLGPGFWVNDGNPSLWAFAQLHITTTDGDEYLVRTHGASGCNSSQIHHVQVGGKTVERTELHSSWKVHDDPCLFSDMYKGEHYDARLEVPEWDSPTFDDRSWLQAFSPTISQCTVVPENSVAAVGCSKDTDVITAVDFASFGTPTGQCKNCTGDASTFAKSKCDAHNSTAIVTHLCVGKNICSLKASRKLFGDPCRLVVKHLSVSVTCGSRDRLEKKFGTRKHIDLAAIDGVPSTPAPPAVSRLSSHPMTHITSPLEPIPPVSVKEVQPHVFVFDFGVNLAGVCLIAAHEASSGTVISLMKGEELFENGTVKNQLSVNMTTVYISKGGKTEEAWSPSWVYYGFQYVQVTGVQSADDIKLFMLPMTSAAVTVGNVEFEEATSAGMLMNSVQVAIHRTQASNLMSIPTDCPNREKRGWMGDAQVSAKVAMWNYDMPAFYSNWIRTMSDVQIASKTGVVPDIVPGRIGGTTDATWSSAYPLISFYMYQHYGDKELIEEHFAGLKAYVDYLTTTTDKDTGLLTYHKYGDWCNMYPRTQEIPTTGPISACFHYMLDLQLVSGFAGLVGNEAEVKKYMDLHDSLIEPFNKYFYNESVGGYVDGTQTVNLLPLFAHYVPEAKRETVETNLLHDIMVQHDMHLTTGAVGTRFLLPVITQLGRPDVALALANQSTFPSWGYWITQGATSLWENWSGHADLTHPPAPTHDHIFLGSHGSWLYEVALGIQPALPGFEKISIRPLLTYFNNVTIASVCRETESSMVLSLPGASGSYESVRGTISVQYMQSEPTKADNTVFQMTVDIPPNTNATVYLPQRVLCTLTEDGVFPPAENITIYETGRVIWADGVFKYGTPGITSGGILGQENAIAFEVGSGYYQFRMEEVR